jgi:hypothetical protein
LLGPYSSYVHHYAFRGTGYDYEEAIREVARLLLEGALMIRSPRRRPTPGWLAAISPGRAARGLPRPAPE